MLAPEILPNSVSPASLSATAWASNEPKKAPSASSGSRLQEEIFAQFVQKELDESESKDQVEMLNIHKSNAYCNLSAD